MAEFRVWVTRRGEQVWVAVTADTLEAAEKLAAKRWRGRVLSVRPIVKRNAA